MIACKEVLPERKKQIIELVRDQIIYAMKMDLEGDESLMKEVWEEMETDEEEEVAKEVLRSIMKSLGNT